MISDNIPLFFSFFPAHPAVLTFILSALPVVELRGAIPFAHSVLHLNWGETFFWSYLGSLTPGIIILLVAASVISWCNSKSRLFEKVMRFIMEKKRKHFHKKYERYGDMALFIIAAMPFPLAGVWSAALVAIIFEAKLSRSIVLIAAGNLMAGLIVLWVSAGFL